MQTVQVAVRFTMSQLAYLDQLVAEERAGSRAEAVRLALENSRRADRDAADLAAYAATDDDESFEALAAYGVSHLDA